MPRTAADCVPAARVSAACASAALCVLSALAPTSAGAQQARTSLMPQWEARADATIAPAAGAHLAGHAGVGVNVRLGPYARLGTALALGVIDSPDEDAGPESSARVDVVGRFLLDPFAERRTGLYGGAGFTARADGAGAWKGNLLIVFGFEGPAEGRIVPALEVALGGGARIGLVWRGKRRGSTR
ncbi:MAG TPA: hypothetical protein VFM71_10970 [Gemmatimonadaceae bacterium]|nr:hypothetical protein [Gemmatimonadaceae bacterium]